jgi:hypothetical protein
MYTGVIVEGRRTRVCHSGARALAMMISMTVLDCQGKIDARLMASESRACSCLPTHSVVEHDVLEAESGFWIVACHARGQASIRAVDVHDGECSATLPRHR